MPSTSEVLPHTAPVPAALIVNSQARDGGDTLGNATRILQGEGLPLSLAILLEDPRRLGDAVRDALAQGAKLIVVGGGDGSLSAAANVLARTDATLGILPLGTANDFARNLRIPRDLQSACRAIVHGRRRRVDLGKVDGRCFVNATSFGLTGAVTRRITPDLKRRAGRLAYPVAAASEVAGTSPFTLSIEADGLHRTVEALQVVVGNGRFHGGGRLIAPGARIDDHLLDFYAITEETSRAEATGTEHLRRLWLLGRVGMLLRRGRHLEHANVLHVRTGRLTLTADPPQELDVDGELFGTTPATFEVVAAALWVMTPA